MNELTLWLKSMNIITNQTTYNNIKASLFRPSKDAMILAPIETTGDILACVKARAIGSTNVVDMSSWAITTAETTPSASSGEFAVSTTHISVHNIVLLTAHIYCFTAVVNVSLCRKYNHTRHACLNRYNKSIDHITYDSLFGCLFYIIKPFLRRFDLHSAPYYAACCVSEKSFLQKFVSQHLWPTVLSKTV